MSKRIIYISIAIFAVISVSIYFVFIKSNNKFNESSALMAVPTSSPLIIKINNLFELENQFAKNEMINSLKTVPQFGKFIDNVNQIGAFINSNEQYQKLLKGADLVLAMNYSGKEAINPLFLISIKSKSDFDLINKIINNFKADPEIIFQSRKYDKSTIHTIERHNNVYYLSIHNGVFIVSTKSLLVEEAIRQIELNTIENDPGLNPLLKTVGQQADLNLFINHKNIEQFLSKCTSLGIKNKVAAIKLYSGWTELDLNLNEDNIVMSGFSNGDPLEPFFANVFTKQQPVTSKIEEVLPFSTYFFTNLNLSNTNEYFNDYAEYLEKRNLFFQREDKLLSIKKETGIDVSSVFKELFVQEAAIAGITIDQSNATSGRIWIVETKSGSTALAKMLEIQGAYIIKNKLQKNEWEKSYAIDDQTSFEIYKFPYPDFPKTMFGELFSGINANWFATYNNYLIFGDSYRTVSKTIHSNVLGETLTASNEYNKFKSNLNARYNILFYSNTAVALPIAGILFNESIASQINNNDELRKFKAFAWQVTSANRMLYNNACFSYSKVIKSKPQTIWQSHVDAPFDCKPKFVINHDDRLNKEIVLQDKENTFYLINNVGRVIWQIKVDGPIIGEIHQIDYFRNGKLQYLFNTANKLYLIDRNGNSVKNFPVNLRSQATNGVAVFDYDNNKEYRFFIAGTDHNIYAYNKEGNLLDGWDLFHTDHDVTQPIQHFRVEGRDYVVASDIMKDYILHRKGTIRVKTNEVYPHSINNTIYLEERTTNHAPRIVTTDSEGSIHYTYLDDGKIEVLKLPELSKNHYFVAENINANNEAEYLFADGKQFSILDINGKTILRKKFDEPILHQPNIYTFSNGVRKVGITCSSINKIFLFDTTGAMHPGFPLDGCTEFSIGFITDEMSNFNLLVGSPDGYLYNYYVE